MSIKPIGIFDSGVGGTTIWRAIHHLMPSESTCYLADSKNAPYGHKSKEEILELCVRNTDFLIDKGCKIIVVACNTATTAAIQQLRTFYDLPFVGVEPAIKPAALESRTGVVGVLATEGTLGSEMFHKTSEIYASGVEVITKVGVGIVEILEQKGMEAPELPELLQNILHPMLEKDMDRLVLGCTHYPYLIPILKKILPQKVMIVEASQAVALHTQTILKNHNLMSPSHSLGKHEFYTNGKVELLKSFLANEQPFVHISALSS